MASAFEQEVNPDEWETVARRPIPATRNTRLVSFRVSSSLHHDVNELAREQGVSFSDVVREALTSYMEAKRHDGVPERKAADSLEHYLLELREAVLSLAVRTSSS